MTRRRHLALGCGTTLLVLLLLFLIASVVTTIRLNAALNRLPEPDSLRMHRMLAEDVAEADEKLAPLREKLTSFKKVSGAFPWSLDWDDLMKEHRRPDRRREDYWEALASYLDEYTGYIEQLRARAAEGGPVAIIDVSKGRDVENYHIGKVRQMASMLARDAEVAERRNDMPRAVHDVIAMLQLGSAMASEPTLWAHEVRFSVTEEACALISQTLPADLAPDTAQKLLDALRGIDHRDEFAAAYLGDARMNELYMRDPKRLIPSSDSWEGRLAVAAIVPLARPLLNLDALTYVEFVERLHGAAHLPYHQARVKMAAIEADVSNLPVTRIFSMRELPGLGNLIADQAQLEASLDIAQIGLLVEQHFQAFGQYPASLDAIEAQFPDGLTMDVFSGQSYIYRPTADGFLLYSVGVNGTDDGGLAGEYPARGDVVWRATPAALE